MSTLEMQAILRPPGAARRIMDLLFAGFGTFQTWRNSLRTYETDEPTAAMDLFSHRFGHPPPNEPRHFVLAYFPPPGCPDRQPRVVAYTHQRPYDEVYLGGGMCVDERVYRQFPRWLFKEVSAQGGLATIVVRDSIAMLGESVACFGHVGESRARQADLRTGFVDAGPPHLMVYWRRDITRVEKERLVRKVQAYGPF